ncbi:MAG TPA: hypothetical protein DCM86_11110 [Verrucomicrobiales bacterium]|nr:hypothetical protein [Verrucomicrobiales bacterium]
MATLPLVVALNPSVDAEWSVPQIQFEEKNEIQSERRWAGGKGINVARWLRHLGTSGRLLLPLGGPTGREIAACLASERLDAEVVAIHSNSRVNVIVTPPRGHQMRFNAIPPRLSGPEWRALAGRVKELLPKSSMLVLSGSLPLGVPPDAYARLIRLANAADVPTLLDCEGPALVSGAGAAPLLIKPNHAELEAWCGFPLATEERVIEAARLLRACTGGWVMASGGHRGAWLVGPGEREIWSARPERTRPRNTVGAGDAMVAAAVRSITRGEPPAAWVAAAVSAGTASTCVDAGALPSAALLKKVRRGVRLTYVG